MTRIVKQLTEIDKLKMSHRLAVIDSQLFLNFKPITVEPPMYEPVRAS